jgi:hypothetical protein
VQPDGTVTFYDGTTVLGIGTLHLVCGVEVATFTTSSLSVGTHSITAAYAGSNTFAPSTSAVLCQIVKQCYTSISCSSSYGSAPGCQPVTFTACISVPCGTPTGSVQFKDGNTVLGSGTINLVNGKYVASFTTSSLCVGTHSITPVFGGNSNFAGSTTSALKQVITAVSTTTSVSASTTSTPVGQAVTFKATVRAASGTPGGTVTFKDGNTVIGTGTLSVVNGVDVATFTTSNLAIGNHPITAVYAANGSFTGSTSSSLTESITKAATTSSLGGSLNGQVATFTASVHGASGAGSVTFMDGTHNLGTYALVLVSGVEQVSFSTSSLSVGVHSITAVYSGNSTCNSSTSPGLMETIVKPAANANAVVAAAASAADTVHGSSQNSYWRFGY